LSKVYKKDPRYLTLKKRHGEVKDLDSLKDLMGHNEQTLPTPGDIKKHIEKVE